MSPKNEDFEALLNDVCSGLKECQGREPSLDHEDCRACLSEAIEVVFDAHRKDYYER